jgi:hypothetical protein
MRLRLASAIGSNACFSWVMGCDRTLFLTAKRQFRLIDHMQDGIFVASLHIGPGCLQRENGWEMRWSAQSLAAHSLQR